ncbi:MAG: type VI secretion system ImpA family N-terminal domain-containing protein [Gemmobacter sp.]
MRLDDLLKPVSADAPCGPDLLAEDDPDFADYYYSVEDRLPTSYFNVARGALFDPRSVDLKAESAQIDALLKRSRDIRLLVLEAKFQILAGRLGGFAGAVAAVAALIETFPEDLNPRMGEDEIDRRNALEELDTLATVVAPLEYAVLVADRRAGDITFRAWATGAGRIPPREGEEAGDAAGVEAALGASENAEAVAALHGALADTLAALDRIRAACRAGSPSFAPTFERLPARLAEMLDLVRRARPDLDPEAAAETPAGEGPPADTPPEAGAAAAPAAPVAEIPGLPDHAAARRLLEGVERYFAQYEPSALALVLVTQARLLIGRPLVEALDVLLEGEAERAQLGFGSQAGFVIPMARMRALSEQAGIGETPGAESEAPAVPGITGRDQAGAALKAAEDFFRLREPASPIPILLFKARNSISKDFHAILRELLPDSED